MKHRKGLGGTDTKLAFEVWKYYGGIGGDDKNKMIQIVSWLLGFSAAIIGFYASGKLTEGMATILLVLDRNALAAGWG